MKFETIWPEGVLQATTQFSLCDSVEWRVFPTTGNERSGSACSVQDVIDAFSDLQEEDVAKFGITSYCGALMLDVVDVLRGGFLPVRIRRGAPSLGFGESLYFILINSILSLSPNTRLVGTWKDGTPVTDGEILFHII